MQAELYELIKNQKPLMTETGYWETSCATSKWSINLSSIATKLIQETGRFCESYASDFLINWQTIEDLLTRPMDTFLDHDLFGMQIFGIRQMGVDGIAYLLSRAKNNTCRMDDYYRKVYAVVWLITPETKEIKIKLYDIHSQCYELQKPYRKDLFAIKQEGTPDILFDQLNRNLQPVHVKNISDHEKQIITYIYEKDNIRHFTLDQAAITDDKKVTTGRICMITHTNTNNP